MYVFQHSKVTLWHILLQFMDAVTGHAYNVIFALKDELRWVFESMDRLPEGSEPQITVEERQ